MKKITILILTAVVGLGGITLLVGNDESGAKNASPTNAVTSTRAVTPTPTNELSKTETPEAPKPVAVPAVLSPGVEEIIQLAQARVGDEVLLAYIEASTNLFQLKADEILYLLDLGVSAEVVAAMVRHGQVLKDQATVAEAAASAPLPAARVPEVAAEQPANPPPEPPPEAPAAPATEEAVAPVANANPQVTHNYFYNNLSPYGNWVEVPDYGWCWQPAVAVINTGWQPYCDNGRWVYTDCGWYWNSYYSWGWAPFHYGRWYNSPARGWVWAPGTTWGPAWVTWRYYNGYCGWAPLPPACGYSTGLGLTYYGSGVGFSFGFGLSAACYTFVPTTYFYCGTPWRYRVPHHQGIALHKNSTVINNYVRGHGNLTVINVGPGTSRIAAASRSEIRRVSLRDLPASGERTIRGEQLSRDGASLAVYRPKLPEQSPRPPAEITHRQQESRRRADELANSEAVKTASTQARINHTVAPQRGLTGKTTARPQSPTSPPVHRVGTGTAPGSSGSTQPSAERPVSRNESRRGPGATVTSPRSAEVRRETSQPRTSPTPAVTAPSRREETPRQSSPAQVSPISPRSPITTSRPSTSERVVPRPPEPVQQNSSLPSPVPSRRTETVRPTLPVQPSSQPLTAPAPQYAPRSESPTWRTPSPQPSYQPPVMTPSHSAPSAPTMSAPRSAPSYSPSPSPQPSSAPASWSPSMSSPSFSPSPSPAPAPARSQPSAPPSSPSRGSSSGRER